MKTHDPLHRQSWDLIPWLVNDTLDEFQRASVEAHVRECGDCREELAFQTRVHAGMLDLEPTIQTVSPETMARMFERIDAENDTSPDDREGYPSTAGFARPVSTRATAVRPLRIAHLLAAAVIVEAIGLVGLGTMLAGQHDAPATDSGFATLSASEQPVANASIRLVPSPILSVGDLQSLLSETELRIVDSNAGGTILALGFEAAPSLPNAEPGAQRRRIDAAVQRLRANSGVLLAEPIFTSMPDAP